MDENSIIKIIDEEMEKAENSINTMSHSKMWPEQGHYAKKAVIAQQKVLVAVVTLLKGAISAS